MSKIDREELKKIAMEIYEEKETEKVESKAKEKTDETKTVEADIDIKALVQDAAKDLVETLKSELGGDKKDTDYLREKVYSQSESGMVHRYPSLDELKDLDDTQQIATYFKALIKRERSHEDQMILKGLSAGVAEDGGNLVPTPLHNEIARILPDLAIMRTLATEIPMTSLTLKLPTQTTQPVSYWIPERANKTTTSAEFGQITLTANKLVTRILVSEELNDDAIVAMVPMLTQRFAESIATAEDKAFFTGSGSGQPKGINQESISSLAIGASLDFDDVNKLMWLVPQSVKNARGAAYVANAAVIQQLQRIKDNDGAYIWRMGLGRNDGQTTILPNTIWGKPIFEQNDLADSELYFGDWKNYIIGDRKQLSVRTTDTTETTWAQDAIDIKAVERVDGRAVLTTPFAKLTGI